MTIMTDLGRNAVPHTNYGQRLSQVHKDGWRVYDPSYALSRDIEAHDKITRDPVVQQAVAYRKHLVAGRKYTLVPASDDERDIRAAQLMTLATGKIRMFTSARFNLAGAFMRGGTWGIMLGDVVPVKFEGTRIPLWIPVTIKDMNKLSVIGKQHETPEGFVNEWQVWDVKENDFVPMQNPEMYVKHTYNDVEETIGFGGGLIDAGYYTLWAKSIIFEEGLGAVERFGRGFLVAKVDATHPASKDKTNVLLRGKVLDELEKNMARHILAVRKGTEIDVIQGPGQGWQVLTEMLAYCDNALRTLILGASMPTGDSEGGSYALAKVQENSTEALIQYDRELLGETITDQVVSQIWDVNQDVINSILGGEAEMPHFQIQQEKAHDPEVEARVASTMLQHVSLKRDEVLEKVGYSVPKEGDDVIEPTAPGENGLGGFSDGAFSELDQAIRSNRWEQVRDLWVKNKKQA